MHFSLEASHCFSIIIKVIWTALPHINQLSAIFVLISHKRPDHKIVQITLSECEKLHVLPLMHKDKFKNTISLVS